MSRRGCLMIAPLKRSKRKGNPRPISYWLSTFWMHFRLRSRPRSVEQQGSTAPTPSADQITTICDSATPTVTGPSASSQPMASPLDHTEI
ncbi:hypothetical protein AVEN_87708-1 [Araneus ventricosus]|uniref:Uncharacterized protein n=1 Tax=Araneus ventricosus TaxID=182803 RepID=A0A4Y2QL33_ARAVE|nr:hypothetical protein AVEN_265226-1 [Araneus ventricosus]GBN63975.1 hypothetical protein AVEN_87708-1 [Araneus ventricosus]